MFAGLIKTLLLQLSKAAASAILALLTEAMINHYVRDLAIFAIEKIEERVKASPSQDDDKFLSTLAAMKAAIRARMA